MRSPEVTAQSSTCETFGFRIDKISQARVLVPSFEILIYSNRNESLIAILYAIYIYIYIRADSSLSVFLESSEASNFTPKKLVVNFSNFHFLPLASLSNESSNFIVSIYSPVARPERLNIYEFTIRKTHGYTKIYRFKISEIKYS